MPTTGMHSCLWPHLAIAAPFAGSCTAGAASHHLQPGQLLTTSKLNPRRGNINVGVVPFDSDIPVTRPLADPAIQAAAWATRVIARPVGALNRGTDRYGHVNISARLLVTTTAINNVIAQSSALTSNK